MKNAARAIPWLILSISFAIPALFYNSLPDEILIARSFFGSDAVVAPKSLFTVFRVPLIETVCAAVVEIMRRNCALAALKFAVVWNILLYSVAFKAFFQSLEIASTGNAARLFFYLTIGVVAAGLTAAVFLGWKFFPPNRRTVWNFKSSEKALLIALLLGYFGLAIVPVMVYK